MRLRAAIGLIVLLAGLASGEARAQSDGVLQLMPAIRRDLQQQLADIRKETASNGEQAIQRYSALLEAVGPQGRLGDRLTLLTLRGQQKGIAKKFDEAVADLTEAINLSGAYALPFYFRAAYEAERDNGEAALADIARALELEPRYIRAIHLRGRIRHKLRQYDQAIADYSQYLALQPHEAIARLELAQAQYQSGRRAKALIEIDKLLAKFPKDPLLLAEKAVYLRGVKDDKRALEYADRIAALVGETDGVHMLRTHIHFATGSYDAAEADAKRAFDLGLSRGLPIPYAAIYLQAARLRLGRPDPADLARRQELTNTGPWARALAEYMGDQLDAAALLARAAEIDARGVSERVAAAQFFIGQRELARGAAEPARRAFQAAIDTGATWTAEHELAGRELERLGR